MVHHELPTSDRGWHVKVKSLLEDPSICTEMQTYLHSHKWATNPKKFADFMQQKLFPAEAEKYAKHIINKEMPCGLKKYLEVKLFLWIQMRHFDQYSLPMDGTSRLLLYKIQKSIVFRWERMP